MLPTMQVSTENALSAKRSRMRDLVVRNPLILLALTIACLPLALVTTLVMPIGPMYWDHYIYIDAANRIFDGQVPSTDFFAPVGALGYYLFAGWLYVFPNGHALLLSSWSLLTVTAPLMALIVRDVQKRSAGVAYALLLPFLVFSLLPFNTGEFYPYPGSDGFGIYNRQICQLLYVLAAALVWVKGTKTLATVTALTMLALLFVKITGLVAGIILCLTAFATGRLPVRVALAAGLAFFSAIGLLEGLTGIVSDYANDILSLLILNDGSLLPRLLQAASINFGIVLTSCLLGLTLLVGRWTGFLQHVRLFVAKPGLEAVSKVFDQPFIWLAGFVFAGVVFESQNTGSQAFIFLWPLLLAILSESDRRDGKAGGFAAITILALAVALPPLVTISQKAARAWIGIVNTTPIAHRNLKSMGAVSIRDTLALRTERLRASYTNHRDAYDALAASSELPSFLLYSDFDFQALWVQNADEAVAAIHAYEAANAVRFETIMMIDFTNPFPWLLDRHAPRHIAIGADPYRAVPPPDERAREAVGGVDLALYPTCPPTSARLELLRIYQPLLASSHRRITLTPCFDAFVREALGRQP